MKEKEIKTEIKLSFISGLKDIVLTEIGAIEDLKINEVLSDTIFLDYTIDFGEIKKLRSVSRAYLVLRNERFNPYYISRHKSVLGSLIENVLANRGEDTFKTYKIICAGSESSEVQSIAQYVHDTYHLQESEQADLKIEIIKVNNIWEVGLQITSRPLSFRDYKINNMSGAMDPTIVFALNFLAGADRAESYLNAFCGSGTLLIEAGLSNPNIKKLIGFDNTKKHLSLAIGNIRAAGLIERIQVKEADILANPDFGKFDIIVADLPFGMVIGKDKDLNKLYETFIEYCHEHININGRVAIYTTECGIIENILSKSNFEIIKHFDLNFTTSVNSFLRPKIYICKLK